MLCRYAKVCSDDVSTASVVDFRKYSQNSWKGFSFTHGSMVSIPVAMIDDFMHYTIHQDVTLTPCNLGYLDFVHYLQGLYMSSYLVVLGSWVLGICLWWLSVTPMSILY